MQSAVLALIVILIGAAMVWIAVRVYKQWHHPRRQYQAQLEDIQRRKRELGIADDDDNASNE